MKPLLRHRHFALVALALWLIASWSGVQGHFCFDGSEPPIAFHINVMDGHLFDEPGEADQDVDIQKPQSLSAKPFQWDVFAPLMAVVFIILLQQQPVTSVLPVRNLRFHPPLRLRPPLRAPPATA